MAEQNDTEAQNALAQLQYVKNAYTQRYELLNSQLTALGIAHESAIRGLELVSNASNINSSEILLSTDDATYITARVGKVESILTYIGGNYLVEKPVQEAKTFLEQNLKENESIRSKLVTEMQGVERELFNISYRIAALTRQ